MNWDDSNIAILTEKCFGVFLFFIGRIGGSALVLIGNIYFPIVALVFFYEILDENNVVTRFIFLVFS